MGQESVSSGGRVAPLSQRGGPQRTQDYLGPPIPTQRNSLTYRATKFGTITHVRNSVFLGRWPRSIPGWVPGFQRPLKILGHIYLRPNSLT